MFHVVRKEETFVGWKRNETNRWSQPQAKIQQIPQKEDIFSSLDALWHIVQTKAPKSVNLCRLHNFFPGTPPPPPSMLFFRSGALDPLTGLQLLGAFGANELFVEKVYQCKFKNVFQPMVSMPLNGNSLNSQFMSAESPNPCHQGVPCISPPSFTIWSKSGVGGG